MNRADAPAVTGDATSLASEDVFVGTLIAYRAISFFVVQSPMQLVAFYPLRRLGVAYRLHQELRHDGGSGEGGLGIDRRCVA